MNTAPCSHLFSYLQPCSTPIILVHRMLPWTSVQRLAISLTPSREQFKYLGLKCYQKGPSLWPYGESFQ